MSQIKTYEVPMGRGVQRWESVYDFYTPQPAAATPCGAFCTIEGALNQPIGMSGSVNSLEALAENAKNVVIVIPDETRGWSDALSMARGVRRRLQSVGVLCVTWVVATGQHKPASAEYKKLFFEDEAMIGCGVQNDSWISHDCDAAVGIGLVTPMGTPVTLNPAFAKSDLVVLIGGIIYHDMAGFSGGRKTIIPGISGRHSIVKNHNFCLKEGGLNPDTDCGLLDTNPMAIDLKAYANLALTGKKCFIVNAVAGMDGKPKAWVAGDLWKAWEVGVRTAVNLQTLWSPVRPRRVISSCGGFPYDMDLYQGTKGIFSVLDVVESDGAVVLVADLEDSLGPGDFEGSLRRALADPADVLHEMERAFTVPGYIALRTVLQLSNRPAALVTSRENVPFPGRIFKDVQSADRWLQEVSGTEGPSMLIPSGNSIHVALKK